MGRKTALVPILLGVLTLAAGASSDDVQSSTSTSVSVSTVTRKVTSRSFSRSYQGEANVTQAMPPVTEDVLRAQDAEKSSSEDAGDGKPQKVKKKILASNLKNLGEKPNPPKSIANATEPLENGKPNSSDSVEEDLAEEAVGRSENGTAENKGSKGRSLEDQSSEENANVNGKARTKVPPPPSPRTTSQRTTSGYSYETYGGEAQKVLNNNYLNNEGYDQRSARPGPSPILPGRKSTPVSQDNSLKNAIRFESEYYGPTGQTDWVPIVPETLPARSPAGAAQNFGGKLKPGSVVVGTSSNRTAERNAIAFPTDGVQPTRESNAIPVREQEVEKTTIRQRNAGDRQRATTSTERPSTQPVRHVTKFRGAVRYRPLLSNATSDESKFQNETVLKRSNVSAEVPATGTSTTLAGPSGVKTSEKSVREETTEISVVSSTNHTTKSQKTGDGGVAVPPESVKMENVTKEQQRPKTPMSVALPEEPSGRGNETATTTALPEAAAGSQGWLSVKPGNETEVVDVPGSVDSYQRHESTPVPDGTKSLAAEPETTSVDVTTEEPTTTETTPELTTYLKVSSAPTETPAVSDASSQSSGDANFKELPETTAHSGDDKSATASVTATPDAVALPTTLRSSPGDEAVEKTTEAQQTTTASSTVSATSEVPLVVVASSAAQKEAANATTTTAGTTTTAAAAGAEEATPFTPVNATTTTTTRPKAVPVPVTKTTPEVTKTTTATTASTTTPPITTTTTPKPSTFPSTAAPASAVPTTETTRAATTAATTTTSTTPTTSAKTPEATEEGIYYKNYVPTTVDPHGEITEENVPAYLRLTVQAKGWEELCRLKDDLRDAIMRMLGGKNVSSESVHFLNLNERNCLEKIEETKGDATNETAFLPVNMFLMDRNGDFDKNLSEAFLTLWGRRGLDFELPIRKVDFVTPIVNLTELADSPLGGSVVAAIVISCVAGICVILLGILFVIMKRRQKRFNYGQRCTPVSLDAYSLDSVSIYNSVRRKGVRASKRSYGNAAFDDPEVPTHPMNFAGLANFSSDREQLHEEFNIIPQVYPKVEELPAGAETKNRYANIIPLPETRVHLSVKDGDALSDYINANYVRGLKGAEKLYIACQAPLESTVEDFWRMIWEQQCKVVLMLTDLQENGIEKCADYLPPNEVTDNLRLFGDFQVTLKKRDVKEKYIISYLKLKNLESNLWREVTHLWYLGWPDQGVPSEANSLIAFLIEARSQMKIQNGATTSSPVVVHCSPGTGRTGTVMACDLCIREYEQSRMVDIPKCVFNLRRDRAGCVQTKDQYAFIYQVLNVYATKLSGGGIESI